MSFTYLLTYFGWLSSVGYSEKQGLMDGV